MSSKKKAADTGKQAELAAQFVKVDDEGTYSTMMKQSAKLGHDIIIKAVVDFVKAPQNSANDDAPFWKSGRKLRARTSDTIVKDSGVTCGFLMLEPGKLACELRVMPVAPANLTDLDIYINGRLAHEFTIPGKADRPLPFYRSYFVVDVPKDIAFPMEVEICNLNRVVDASDVTAPVAPADADVDGAFVDIRQKNLLFWGSDRNDRARSVLLHAELDGESHPCIAHLDASFTRDDVREARIDVSMLDETRDCAVVLKNGDKPLRRGRFLLRRDGDSYVVWRCARSKTGDLYVTALAFDGDGFNEASVQLEAGKGKTALVPLNQPDLGAFAFLTKHNSARFAHDTTTLTGDLRLRIQLANGTLIRTDAFKLDSVPEADLPAATDSV